MIRVKPDKIQGCNCEKENNYWVVNKTNEEIHPFKLLYKEVLKQNKSNQTNE